MMQSAAPTVPTAVNIITCIAVDADATDRKILYPQLAYVSPRDRRAVYWRCAVAFFYTSSAVNKEARHLLYTNDLSPPVFDGVDCGALLRKIGVEIVHLPFTRFKPPPGFGDVFRNNFYKLDVLYAASRALAGSMLMLDSDVVWLSRLPAESAAWRDGLVLYPVFGIREEAERAPTGTSSDDLATVFTRLDPQFPKLPVQWFGGELIGGDVDSLVSFSQRLEQVFREWCLAYDPGLHRFPNGSAIFDNDEFLLSFVVHRDAVAYLDAASFLKRIWTEPEGGGLPEDLSLAAWHLPNEKLRGFRILFSDIVQGQIAISRERVSGACGVPVRLHFYEETALLARSWRFIVRRAKSVMSLRLYNRIRAIFGRDPISG